MPQRITLEAFELEFKRSKHSAESAMAQLDDGQLHVQINAHQNGIAAIVQHMAGNMVSRFTDFLTTDGEKPDRDREGEFIDRRLGRGELLALWDRGWSCVFAALAPLSDGDLGRTVLIRREAHTVSAAVARQLAHYAWHAGQIALIAKHLKGDAWQYVTIPPGNSAEFNRTMGM
jgi:hypothetical protein